MAVLSRGGICERASIDEVYLDITEAAAARLNKEGSVPVESLSEEARKTHILGLLEVSLCEFAGTFCGDHRCHLFMIGC